MLQWNFNGAVKFGGGIKKKMAGMGELVNELRERKERIEHGLDFNCFRNTGSVLSILITPLLCSISTTSLNRRKREG